MGLTTALTGLRANQIALEVVGNNIANAGTPEFHRQSVHLSTRVPLIVRRHSIGQGVKVSSIQRAYDESIEKSINANISEVSSIEQRLEVFGRIESLLTPGNGSILDRLEKFFNELEQLTAFPEDSGARSVFIDSASALVGEINYLAEEFDQIKIDLDLEIERTIEQINEKNRLIADLNERIRGAEILGATPNDLLDRRDQLLVELSNLIDANLEEQTNNGIEQVSKLMFVKLAGNRISFGANPPSVETGVDAQGNRVVFFRGDEHVIPIASGQLGGLLHARNEIVNDFISQLQDFASDTFLAIDTAHATGIGTAGGFASLLGQRRVDDVTIPMAQTESVVPFQAGSLFISITDANGIRTQHEVAIDPDVQSLTDVAAQISLIDHIQAVVNSATGQVTLVAEPGYTFDFSESLPTQLDASLMTGTSIPTISGNYSGSTNDEFTFDLLGSGTIGETSGLLLQVTDASGGIIASHNVGLGYSPGSDLLLSDGVSVQLSVGTVNAGDQFSVDVLASADATGFLAGMGLNSLFTGDGLREFRVNDLILEDPNRLATTSNGNTADTANMRKILDIRYEHVAGDRTLESSLSGTISQAGAFTRNLISEKDNLSVIAESLKSTRNSISGVDPNEEMVRMLQYQQGFQSVARYVVTLDETFQELINIIR